MGPDLAMGMGLGTTHHGALVLEQSDAAKAVGEVLVLPLLHAQQCAQFRQGQVREGSVVSMIETDHPTLAGDAFFQQQIIFRYPSLPWRCLFCGWQGGIR